MILSKARCSISGDRRVESSSQSKRSSVPELQEFLDARDYEGAIALLRFKRQVWNPTMPEWPTFLLWNFETLMYVPKFLCRFVINKSEEGGRQTHVTRRPWSGWHTHIITMQSMIRHWCFIRSFWSCPRQIQYTTLIQQHAFSTWRSTMKPEKLHCEVKCEVMICYALNLATLGLFPMSRIFSHLCLQAFYMVAYTVQVDALSFFLVDLILTYFAPHVCWHKC